MSRDGVVRGHRTFRVLLDCMARPGSVREVPQAAGWSSALEGLALALLDSESGAAVLDPALTGIVLAALEPVGCPLLAPEEAGFVVADGAVPCDLAHLRSGSADYPDASATLVCLVEALSSTGGEAAWKGPGIDGSVSPRVEGLAPEVLPSLQAINASYPIGLDAFFLDRRGQVMALPRSTRIEGGMLSYVAVKGGREAIERACDLNEYRRSGRSSVPMSLGQIREQLHLGVDRVMGEGGLYAPDHAAQALLQAAGDTFEAAFLLRAHRATLPRLGRSQDGSTAGMRVVRRISSAFKDVPGGQMLGPTSDYTLRLLELDPLEDPVRRQEVLKERLFRDLPGGTEVPDTFPRVVDLLRREGLVEDVDGNDDEPFDITRRSMAFPAPRSARLQSLARGETGALLMMAYSSMRGYGHIHPTLAELRVGYVPLLMRHARTGEDFVAGEVLATEAEVVSRFANAQGEPRFQLGYGMCFGQNEIKAISMGVLDRCLRSGTASCPAEDQEFVLYHSDGIESMGFSNHWKLPHYVDFLSDLDRLRKAKASRAGA